LVLGSYGWVKHITAIILARFNTPDSNTVPTTLEAI
jgi:hypothetical protein